LRADSHSGVSSDVFHSQGAGRDYIAEADSATEEAELEQKAERYSQLHADDGERKADAPTGLRKTLKRLRRIFPSRGEPG
jgi:hypothetical protein